MTTLNLGAIMDGIASTLVTATLVDAAHCWGWPVSSYNPPCVVVGYPDKGGIDFDMTFKRGADTVTFPVWYVAGTVTDKAARDLLSSIIDGAVSIKKALEASPDTLGGTVSSVRVTDCDIERISDGADIKYVAARFDVQVYT